MPSSWYEPFMMPPPLDESQPMPGAPPQAAQATPAIDPRVLAQVLGLGSFNSQEAALQRQLMQAQALQQPEMGRHTTGLGAALGGLGGMFSALRGIQQERAANEGIGQLGKQREAARAEFMRGLSGNPALAEQYAQLGVMSGDQGAGELGKFSLQKAMEARAAQRKITEEAERNKREKQEELDRNARELAEQETRDRQQHQYRMDENAVLAQRKLEETTGKEARDAQAGLPPEYMAIGRPTDQQKNKFTTGVSSAEKLKGMTGQLRKMVQEAGTLERLAGPKRELMDSVMRQIQIEAKNVAELGALSGPDFALMQQLAPDPNGLRSMLMGLGTEGLDQVDKWAETQTAGAMKAYGIERRPTREVNGKRYRLNDRKKWEEVD